MKQPERAASCPEGRRLLIGSSGSGLAVARPAPADRRTIRQGGAYVGDANRGIEDAEVARP
ncbi:hypothetical protein GCM10009678_93330 [Actinomadura kijaniata]